MEREFLEQAGIDENIINSIIEESSRIQEQYNTAKNEYEQLLSSVRNERIENAVRMSGAKNIGIVKSLINQDELTFDGINVDGLDVQLEKIKAENDYLFESSSAAKIVSQTMGADNSVNTVRKAMGL